MNVLVIDVGGSNVKLLATGQSTPRRFASGPKLRPQQLVAGVAALVEGWSYDVVSLGYPGLVRHGVIAAEPHNLGIGWVGFDFATALSRPVRIINDAAMQALGGYEGEHMLYLGLGTGLGSAMIIDGVIGPMELARLPYRKQTMEDYVGRRGLERYGKKRWRRYVEDVVQRLTAALEPDYVVLGGGNARKLRALPARCRAGSNADALRGGFRLWDEPSTWQTASPSIH